MKVKRRNTSEQELQAMRLRRENSVSVHKTAEAQSRLRAAIVDSEKIRNKQIQYGILLAAQERLPISLQAASAQRLKELGSALEAAYQKYPRNFPSGNDPAHERDIRLRRRQAYSTY